MPWSRTRRIRFQLARLSFALEAEFARHPLFQEEEAVA